MQKPRKYLVIFALVTAVILSCGIPTSIPILPKEVVVKASPSVSVPLGKVNYNLYSGLSGGNMNGKLGSLENLLGASWLTDLEEQGVKVYDYRPAGSGDNSIQKFLLHYKLNMEDTLGGAGEIDMSEYGKMLKDLTGGTPIEIKNDVTADIPSVNVTPEITVEIPLDEVTTALATSSNLGFIPAYLPVTNDASGVEYKFPDTIPGEVAGIKNPPDIFVVSLKDMKSLTIDEGNLKFTFTLTWGSPFNSAKLELSGFTLREKGKSASITGVSSTSPAVTLSSNGASDNNTSITFAKGTKLPQYFELVCTLKITGDQPGYFQLDITPSFDGVTISGVEDMLLTEKLQSKDPVSSPPQSITDPPSDVFHAVVETGSLKIDELFPPLDAPQELQDEFGGWNLKMNLEQLSITQQNSPAGSEGLLLDGLSPSMLANPNNLSGKFINNQDVMIGAKTGTEGKATMTIDDGRDGNLLTFQNYPIKMSGPNDPYERKLKVNLDVAKFSSVTALNTDLDLDPNQTNQTITQTISDFASYKDWLNYVEFAKGGLGANLTIGTLNTVGGLALYIDIDKFNLHVHRPLINDSTGQNPNSANLNLTNDEDGHRIWGKDLPDNGNLLISVKLGLEDQTAQQLYETEGIMTITDVEPGKPILLQGMTAGLVFDWAFMSVVPQEPKEGEPKSNDLPDYPFKGSFPEAGEDGLDLSAIPKGLVFYIPEEGDEDSDVMSANLYISLKRQKQLSDGVWVDEAADDPGRDGYKETDPNGWSRNLKINLPNLDFRARQGDKVSENLFTYNPNEEKSTGEWALFKPLNLEAPEFAEQGMVKKDDENKDNPFMIYTGSTLPEPNKAIPIGNLAEVFNKNLIGEENLYFEYTVKLSSLSDNEDGSQKPGEIILYPEMLTKRVLASVDLLMVLPLRFRTIQTGPDPEAPVTISIASDLVGGDLFGRSGPEDNGFFDFVTSLGFDTSINNMAGLNVGTFFMQAEYEKEPGVFEIYRIPTPVLDFSKIETKTPNRFTLDSEVMEKIKSIWPFNPEVVVEFPPDRVVRFYQNFNIELQSITVKASGEYTFETGW